MDIHLVRTKLTRIADDIDQTAIDIRRVGNPADVRKSINELILSLGKLVEIEDYWNENR